MSLEKESSTVFTDDKKRQKRILAKIQILLALCGFHRDGQKLNKYFKRQLTCREPP